MNPRAGKGDAVFSITQQAERGKEVSGPFLGSVTAFGCGESGERCPPPPTSPYKSGWAQRAGVRCSRPEARPRSNHPSLGAQSPRSP